MTTPPQSAPPPRWDPAAPPQWQGWTPPPPPRSGPAVAPDGQPLASFGDRFLAFLIDYAIFFAITLLYLVPLMFWYMAEMFAVMEDASQRDAAGQYNGSFDFGRIFLPFIVLMLVSVVVGLGYTYLYYVEYQLRKGGQTLGKRVMKLRVVPIVPQASLTRRDLAMRWLVQWAAAMFVPFLTYIDGFWQLWDKPFQQCLHDKAAKTVVVRVG